MQETQATRVQSLGQEDILEQEMESRSSSLACKIPWREGPVGLQSAGSQIIRHDWATKQTHTPTLKVCEWANLDVYPLAIIISSYDCYPSWHMMASLEQTPGKNYLSKSLPNSWFTEAVKDTGYWFKPPVWSLFVAQH